MTSEIGPPKYVSVVWIKDQSVTTLESKYVKEKAMLFDFDLIGQVLYPDGSNPPNYPEYMACVFQAGSKHFTNSNSRI